MKHSVATVTGGQLVEEVEAFTCYSWWRRPKSDATAWKETISSHSAEALRENVGITQTGRAAAVLIAVPVSMPDLSRHVRLETQGRFHTGRPGFTDRTTWGRWAPRSADMFILLQMFLQQFKSPLGVREREKFESSCLRAHLYEFGAMFSLALWHLTLPQ